MCLGEVVRLDAVSGSTGTGRTGGRALTISLVTLDEPVTAGDWVVVHSGFALQRLDADHAADALSIRTSGRSAQPTVATPPPHPTEEPS